MAPPAIKRRIAALGSGRLSMLNPLIVEDFEFFNISISLEPWTKLNYINPPPPNPKQNEMTHQMEAKSTP